MTKYLISIITVNYNNLEGLQRTFESVLNQTWQEFEYIVVDGGSTDGSVEYINKEEAKLDYWISEKDSGIYNAMNKGLKVSTGKYLLFLNSGDEFINREILHKVHKNLKDSDFYYFNQKIISENTSNIKILPEKLSFSFFYFDTLPHQSTFIKSSLFTDIGYYDETLEIVADWKFFIIAFYKHNARFEHINDVMTNFFRGGISSNLELILKERREVLEQEFSNILKDVEKYHELKEKIVSIRKSRKIDLLIKLGLLKKI